LPISDIFLILLFRPIIPVQGVTLVVKGVAVLVEGVSIVVEGVAVVEDAVVVEGVAVVEDAAVVEGVAVVAKIETKPIAGGKAIPLFQNKDAELSIKIV